MRNRAGPIKDSVFVTLNCQWCGRPIRQVRQKLYCDKVCQRAAHIQNVRVCKQCPNYDRLQLRCAPLKGSVIGLSKKECPLKKFSLGDREEELDQRRTPGRK